jgi:hypothetical protein
MIYHLLLGLAASEAYPLIVGVSKETVATTAPALAVPGTLPPNLCLVIVDEVALPPFHTLNELSNWARAAQVCQSFGKLLSFPAIESTTFDFLDAMRHLYPSEMKIDASFECACSIKRYAGGFVVVRIPDTDTHIVAEVVEALPTGTAIAFLSATDNLFRY